MQVAIYQGQRVLTTSQLAEAYDSDRKLINKNFTRNRDKYTEGKHYIALTDTEKRDFLNRSQIDDSSRNAVTLYIWTERGAWMHAKSLNTDKAWQAYEMLIDEYYAHQIGRTSEQQLQSIDDPMIDKADRLLTFIRNNGDIIDSELSIIMQRKLARQFESQEDLPSMYAPIVDKATPALLSASDQYIYTTADIATVTGLTVRAVSLLASKHKLRKPEYCVYKPFGSRSLQHRQIHYNEAGRAKLIALARKARR